MLAPYDAELVWPLVVRGTRIPQLRFPQGPLRPAGFPDHDAGRISGQLQHAATGHAERVVLGAEGYYKVWLDEPNAWIYPHLHIAAGRMIELARTYRDCYGLYDRAMKQAARELLLAQSSDWAFIMKTGTMVPYAVKRTQDHIMRFTRLYEQIKSNTIDTDFLGNCEWRDNIFPNINWRYYI